MLQEHGQNAHIGGIKLIDKKEFGDNLRRARLNAGLSQKEVATALGYKEYTAYSQYELGKKLPNVLLAAEIATVLGVPLDSLCKVD